MRYRARRVPFAIDTSGWKVEIHDHGITLLPHVRRPADFIDAALQFFAYPCAKDVNRDWLLERLRERMQAPAARAPDETTVAEAECGRFSGWYCEFVADDGAYWRLWELAHGQTELFVAYSTPSMLEADRRRHRAVVDEIMATLT